MNDPAGRSGREPSLGGSPEYTGQEPSLGTGIPQLREALEMHAAHRRNPLEALSPADLEKLVDRRIVFLTSVIDDELAQCVMAQMLFHDRQKRGENIILMIDSPGGSVYAGLAVLDAVTQLHSPLITIGMRQVSGMAILPLIAGDRGKRFLTPDCHILRTPMEVDPDLTQAAVVMQEIPRLRRIINSCFLKYTRIPEADLAIERMHRFGVREALRLGFADHIIHPQMQINTEAG